MKPVTPVLKGLEQYEIILAKDQPQYEPLPALYTEGEEKRVITRWRFSDEEREEISKGADLILEQLTFGHPFQPVCLSVQLMDEAPSKPTPAEIVENFKETFYESLNRHRGEA